MFVGLVELMSILEMPRSGGPSCTDGILASACQMKDVNLVQS